MLLNSPLLRYVEGMDLIDQYRFLKSNWTQDRYCIDSQAVIAPFHFNVPSKNVRAFINWVNKTIVLNLADFIYWPGGKTYDVLLRIATGMLNKLDIPEEDKREIHVNLVQNLKAEINAVELSTLPF